MDCLVFIFLRWATFIHFQPSFSLFIKLSSTLNIRTYLKANFQAFSAISNSWNNSMKIDQDANFV